jgi:hypothetical protein
VLPRTSKVSTHQAHSTSRHSLTGQQQIAGVSLTEPLPQRVSMQVQQQQQQQQQRRRSSVHRASMAGGQPAAVPRDSSRQSSAGQHQQLPPETGSTQHRPSKHVSSQGDLEAAARPSRTSSVLRADLATNSQHDSVTGAGDAHDAGSTVVDPLMPQRVSRLQFMAARLSATQQVPPSRSSIRPPLPQSSFAGAAAAARYSVVNNPTAAGRSSSVHQARHSSDSRGSGRGSGYSSDSEGSMSDSERSGSSSGSSHSDVSSGDEASLDSRRHNHGNRQHTKHALAKSTPW